MCDDDIAPVTRRVLLNTIKKIGRFGGVTLKRLDAGYIKRGCSSKLNKFESKKMMEKSKARMEGFQNSNKYVLRTFINEIIDGKARPRAIHTPKGRRTAGKSRKKPTGRRSTGKKLTGRKWTGKRRTLNKKKVRRLGSRLSKMFPARCRSRNTRKRR